MNNFYVNLKKSLEQFLSYLLILLDNTEVIFKIVHNRLNVHTYTGYPRISEQSPAFMQNTLN